MSSSRILFVFSALFFPVWIEACGYATCPETRPDKLNVHLICHSHDDVGWLKSVDSYYYGSDRGRWFGDTENQRAGVQYIIDSVVKELAFDPEKRFIQVETAFFWRWWNEQDEFMQSLVKDLVSSGQLEFIGGGWSMNDEAAAHYNAIIDQMTLGLVKLNKTFPDGCGVPKVAWQIDPFGHSAEQASIFAKLGFEGFFFGRLDWRDKSSRILNKTMEMIWQSSHDPEDDIFTGVLYNYYFPPPNFCWDLLCNDEPIMDNPSLHEYNLEQISEDFIAYVQEASQAYRTNHVAITTGMDFHYQAAHAWFINLDKLIAHINSMEDSPVHLMYSTPSCYLNSVRSANEAWPQKQGDFFPYASDYHAYWTGFYSSRPTSKRMIREGSSVLQAAKQITAKKFLQEDSECDADCLRYFLEATEDLDRAVGVAQHHDAITGTEQRHVAEDYHRRLDTAFYRWSYTAWDSGAQSQCKYLNISTCDITGTWETTIPKDKEFKVFAYNPSGSAQSTLARFPIPGPNWQVLDAQGNLINSQILSLPEPVLKIPGRNHEDLDHEVVFDAGKIKALSQAEFQLQPTISREKSANKRVLSADTILKTEKGQFVYNDEAKQLKSYQDNQGAIFEFNQEFLYYIGHRGNNSEFEFRASGAYIFRPLDSIPRKITKASTVNLQEGDQYFQLDFEFEPFLSQIVRIPKSKNSISDLEIEWIVGPIPIDDDQGKEFINKIVMKNGWNNSAEFFTDANGRQNMKRQRDFRPDFDLENAKEEEPVASNYYPINSWISMTDSETGKSVTLVTDRSSGASSVTDDSLEVMVHRRLLDDDAFGVQEPLNETEFGQGTVARGTHYLLFDTSPEEQIKRTRKLAKAVFTKPILTFSERDYASPVVKASPGLYELPENVHLLTLAVIPETMQVLLRLEHLFAPGEDEIFSLSAVVSLQRLLSEEGYDLGNVSQVRETTLGANQWKESGDIPVPPNFQVKLSPLQIRTFIIDF